MGQFGRLAGVAHGFDANVAGFCRLWLAAQHHQRPCVDGLHAGSSAVDFDLATAGLAGLQGQFLQHGGANLVATQPSAHALVSHLSHSFGIVSLVFLLAAKRFVPRFPAVVVLMLAASFISYKTGFEASGGAVVGALPAGLPSFYMPTMLSLETFGQLLLPVLVITLVSFIETASSAKVESQKGGQQWNQNQDLIGQGLAKIAAGFSGAFPTSSSFSRSALNLYAGAKTAWASVVGVIMAMLALLFFMPGLHHVPQSVLAAIVVAAIYTLLVPTNFIKLWHVSKMETVSALATFAVTALSAPKLVLGHHHWIDHGFGALFVPAAASTHHRGGFAFRR